jgi:hypothetical protein
MKRIIFILLISLAFAIGNTKCLASNNWTKIEIGTTTENLQKVIILGTKTLIFSNTNCYIGTNLSNWEKIDIPDSRNICPVIFQGYIYINCSDGIYKSKSSDGKNWVKSASITTTSLAANNKKMFALTVSEDHIAYESTDGINFNEITAVQDLYPNSRYGWDYAPNFTFLKAFGDTIYASGEISDGPSETDCHSFDNGVTWIGEAFMVNGVYNDIRSMVITDMELRGYEGLVCTANDHSGIFFIIRSKNMKFTMPYGVFLTLKTFGYPYYAGRSNGGGVIMEGDAGSVNIGNIFYTPEQINRLEANQFYIIGIGSNGAVYVIKNDFTDYLLANSPAAISGITEVSKEKIDIFPNPTSDILNIMATPGETIKVIDLNGRIVKSLLATEEKTVINVSDLNNSVYIVRSGNKVTKFIKK